MGRRFTLLVLAGVALMGAGSASAAPFVLTTSYQYTFPFGDHSVRTLAVGDLNGDGRPDVVAGEFGGKVAIFLNDGHGSFEPPTFLDGQCPNAGVIEGIAGIAIGNFTSSGNADLLVGCDYYLDGFVKYPGNGDGTFGAPVRIEPVQAYTGEDDSRQPTYDGVGMGSLVHGTIGGVPSIAWSEYEAGGGYVICMIPDSDIVGLVDGDRAPTRCSVYINGDDTFDGQLEFPPPLVLGILPFPDSGSPWAFTMAPGDAGLNSGSMRGVVYISTTPPPSQAGFASDDIEPTEAMLGSPTLLAAADLNGDGSSELIAEAGANNEDVAVYQLSSYVDNLGTLVIPDPLLYPTSPAFNLQYGAVSGDFDGDGHLDVAVLGTSPSTVDEYVEVFRGDGSGGLGTAQSTQVSDFTSDSYLATADFNGDGRPDLLTVIGSELTELTDTRLDTLTVAKMGSGSGAVISVPAGIDCGATCSHQYADGTMVTLSATPAPGSAFGGWSGGGCSGPGTCQVTLSGDSTVTAHFTPPPPTIGSFAPGHGGIHATVTLIGSNFTGATALQLNGIGAAFTVVSATKITFTVPAGATNGTIRVVTPGGSATSSGTFSVDPPPAITSFTPMNGTVGTVVTVTGSDLGSTVAVQLGGVLTVPTSVGPNQVVFTVPPGAVTGPIKLLAPAGAATSIGVFTVTP